MPGLLGAVHRADHRSNGERPTNPTGKTTVKKTLAAVAITAIVAPTPLASAVPQSGMGGLCPNASNLAAYIASNYPVHSIGGVRQDALPDHPSGHALDLMVDGDTALGNRIYADLSNNKGQWGIRYMLWQVPNHYNHIHVTVL